MQPVVGVDISKGKSVAFLDRRKPFGKPFQFEHSQAGLNRLRLCLSEVENRTGKQPFVGLPFAGDYFSGATFISCGRGKSVDRTVV